MSANIKDRGLIAQLAASFAASFRKEGRQISDAQIAKDCVTNAFRMLDAVDHEFAVRALKEEAALRREAAAAAADADALKLAAAAGTKTTEAKPADVKAHETNGKKA